LLLEEQDEMVYLGRAPGVLRTADGGAGEGSSSLRELQVGNRRQNNVGYILSRYADSCLFRDIARSNFTRNRRAPILYFDLFVGLPTFGRERIRFSPIPPRGLQSERHQL
jgi:hypothetical protein